MVQNKDFFNNFRNLKLDTTNWNNYFNNLKRLMTLWKGKMLDSKTKLRKDKLNWMSYK